MSYQIHYGSPVSKKYAFRSFGRLAVIIFFVIMIIMRFVAPDFIQVFRQFLVTDSVSAQVSAFLDSIQESESGQGIGAVIVSFCQEVLFVS